MNYSAENPSLDVYLDGVFLDRKNFKLNEKSFSNTLTLGYVDPKSILNLKLIGSLSQFNMWSRILTPVEILDSSKCLVNLKGDIIQWKLKKSDLVNANLETVELSELCYKPESSNSIHIFPNMIYSEATYLCHGIGGEIMTPSTYSEVLTYFEMGEKEAVDCSYYWVGINDINEEGVWKSTKSENTVNYTNWAPDEPNGLWFENCAGIDVEGLIDDSCYSRR